MATPYPGNMTEMTQPAQAATPVVRTIGLPDLWDVLRLGWEDFKAVPSHAIILCVIYPVLGLVLARAVHGYSVLPLLFPLAAGFAMLGLGVLLLALFVTWVATAQAIYIAAFGYEGATGLADFATRVLTTTQGW